MKALITTGGTGGHIYPAIALAEALLKKDPDTELLFVGNSDRMENRIIPQKGYNFIGITAARFNDNVNKLNALKTLYRSYKECLKLVGDYAPDVVIGFGGYVTVPVIMAARKLHIPCAIHEQNSIAGMANKALGHFVNKVVTVYPDVNASFPSGKVVCLGNPRESAVLDFEKDPEVIHNLGLDPERRTVLIVMGSLGSASVNEKMVEILQEMNHLDYNVIYVTGNNNYEDFINRVEETDTLKVLPYIDQFQVAGNCQLIVSRGGATSACEYMALGLPSIIVPSPYVPNNHQFLNAAAMAVNGASIILEEKDLSKETLVPMVNSLIADEIRLTQMSEAARKMSHPQAANDFVRLIEEMAGK